MGYLSKSAINTIKDANIRNQFLGMYDELEALHQAQGTNFLSPANSTQNPSSAAPAAPSISVTGKNGAFLVSITPPTQSLNRILYYEVSYSTSAAFAAAVTTMPVTIATSLVIPSPGTSAYFRVRASYDRQNWSQYAHA